LLTATEGLLTLRCCRSRVLLEGQKSAAGSSGVDTGAASFSQADRQAFANQLDRLLAK